MAWTSQVENFYDQLSQREQRILISLVLVVILFVFFLFAFFIYESFEERQERIEALKTAAIQLQKNRNLLQENRQALVSLEMKAINKPPMLQGHLDQLAKQYDLSSTITPQKPRDLGDNKEFVMESAELIMHDVPVKQFMQFLDKIERGNYLLMITEIKMNTRRGQPDRMDPVLTVSSYYKRSAAELKELSDKEKDPEKTRNKDKEDKDAVSNDI